MANITAEKRSLMVANVVCTSNVVKLMDVTASIARGSIEKRQRYVTGTL